MGISVGGCETFSIREGWIPKALKIIKNYNGNPFLGEDAVVIFGMGSNMIKSIRYYLKLANTITEQNGKVNLNKEYGIDYWIDNDPYFEDEFSYYLFHYLIVTSKIKETVFSYLFNNINSKTFTKEDIKNDIINYAYADGKELNENTLEKDIDALVSTYYKEDKKSDVENSYVSPLVGLRLLKKLDNGSYEKINGNISKVPIILVFYLICECIGDNDAISLNELINTANSPSKVFNLNDEYLYSFIDRLKRDRYIRFESTAGLNMIYLNKKLSLKDVIEDHFK